MSLPRQIPKNAWAPALVLTLLSGLLFSLFDQEPALVLTRTSYGGTGPAYGAAFDLLSELGLKPRRTRARFSERDPKQTYWIVEPQWSAGERSAQVAALEQLAERGATVLLMSADPALLRALTVLKEAEPSPEGAPAEPSPRTRAEEATRAAQLRDEIMQRSEQPQPLSVNGAILPKPRRVQQPALHVAATQLDHATALLSSKDSQVLAAERTLGKGRVVALFGDEFLTNQRIGQLDNALLVTDLVRAYGAPTFDERCHGLHEERSPWSVLGVGSLLLLSAALLFFCVTAVLSLRRWPAPVLRDEQTPPPTLEVFVASLSALYRARGQREPGAVFRAYRAGMLPRLMRLSFGQAELSEQHFLERLELESRKLREEGRFLRPEAEPRSRAELLEAAASLEQYAASVAGRRKKG